MRKYAKQMADAYKIYLIPSQTEKCNSLLIKAHTQKNSAVLHQLHGNKVWEEITDVLHCRFGLFLKSKQKKIQQSIWHVQELVKPSWNAAGLFQIWANPRAKTNTGRGTGARMMEPKCWNVQNIRKAETHRGLYEHNRSRQYNQPFLFKARTQLAFIVTKEYACQLGKKTVWEEGGKCMH